ncbi:MAG: hypothetical protein RHS_1152 [Robinsoniella sp. RHS]|nr:MAG: hypothetical protein RHS_1152 [Robinsoniella sp. RHS]
MVKPVIMEICSPNIGGADSYITKELEKYIYTTFVKEI